jgi:hypothetical protein
MENYEGITCIGWKLWYADREGRVETFSSKQGSWRDAPSGIDQGFALRVFS